MLHWEVEAEEMAVAKDTRKGPQIDITNLTTKKIGRKERRANMETILQKASQSLDLATTLD